MKVLVTGGAGFLGSAISRRLLERGDEVRAFQRSAAPELEQAGAEIVQGDISDAASVREAASGCELVVHTAAKAGVWGPSEAFDAANIEGTRNVVDACRSNGINRLVYTSSPSAIFSAGDEDNVDESAPYPEHFLADYPRTKAAAEKIVMGANDAGLATVSLRPHLIWGPGDPHLVPRIVDRARRGRLRLLGKRKNLVDSTYIDNAAEAHILAIDRIQPGAACAGKTYFISNAEPLPMAELVNRILAAAGLPAEHRTVPPGIAYAVGATLEVLYSLIGRTEEPPVTRFVAKQLSTSHWYDLTAARRDLGYEPSVSIDEGMKRLAEAFQNSEESTSMR